MREDLKIYKNHPRILELRLAAIISLFIKKYGEVKAFEYLKLLSLMFDCEWSSIYAIFTKYYEILNDIAPGLKRRKQEIIFMGNLYNETRYYIADHYLGMSKNYLYQMKEEHNTDIFADRVWLQYLNDESIFLKDDSSIKSVEKFILDIDNFVSIFK